MAVPSTQTEAQAKTFMHNLIGAMADVLGWTIAGGNYDEAINEALYLYGETTIGNISGETEVEKLRAMERIAIWRRVVQAVPGYFDYRGPSGESYSRSQMLKMAKEALRDAEMDAMLKGWMPGYEIKTLTADYVQDPYGERDWDEKDLAP